MYNTRPCLTKTKKTKNKKQKNKTKTKQKQKQKQKQNKNEKKNLLKNHIWTIVLSIGLLKKLAVSISNVSTRGVF